MGNDIIDIAPATGAEPPASEEVEVAIDALVDELRHLDTTRVIIRDDWGDESE